MCGRKNIFISLWSFIFLCFSTLSWGQIVSITGHLADEHKQPLVAANVHIQKKQSGQIIAFSITDQEGSFLLSFKAQDSLTLNASYLGFAPFKKELVYDSLVENQYMNIVLSAKVVTMDAFTVNGSTPMLIKGDTIVFDPSYFSDGTESVAEDILKKLPGIQVAENGSIKVNGKPIETIMIDGDNIVGQQYEILSKNLSTRLIDKIEILDKFQNNPLYKNVESSDKVAINIRLEKKKNAALFGNAEMALATNKFYEGRLNTISLFKKIKLYSFSSANNIGEETGDEEILMSSGSFQTDQHIGDRESLSKTMDLRISQPDLKAQYFRFNQAKIGNVHLLYSPNSKLKAKVAFSLAGDLVRLYNQTERISQLSDAKSFKEGYEYKNHTNNTAANFSLIWSKNQEERMEYQASYGRGKEQTLALLFFNRTPLQEQLNTIHSNSDHMFDYTKKIADNQLFTFTARQKNQRIPQHYTIWNNVDSSLNNWFNLAAVWDLQQIQTTGLKYTTIEAKYLKNQTSFHQSYNLIFSDLTQKMVSNLLLNSSSIAKGFSNDFQYRTLDVGAYSRQQFNLNKKFNLFARAELHYSMNSILEETQESAQKLMNSVFPNLNIGFNFNWSKKQKFMLSYNLINSTPELEHIQPNYTLQDYRTITRGISSFELIKNSTLLFNYTYGGWSDGLLINANFIYSAPPNYISSQSVFVNTSVKKEAIFLPSGKKMYIYNLSLDRYIKSISCNFRVNTTYSNQSLINVTNGMKRQVQTDNLSINSEIRSVFNGGFNFHFGANWRRSTSLSPIILKNNLANSFIDFSYSFNKKWLISAKNDLQFIGIPGRKTNSYLFTDGEIHYQTGSRTKLLLSIHNVFNVDSYQTFAFNDVFSTVSSYRLLPRYVMLCLNIGF